MRAPPSALLAAAALAAAGACGTADLALDDGGILPLDPGDEAGGGDDQPACRRLENYADDASARAFGGYRGGCFWVLASGGASGGVVPARVDLGASAPFEYLLADQAGSCRALAMAADEPYAVAACSHDPLFANGDGGDEVFLLGLDDGSIVQLTDEPATRRIPVVAIDAAATRVAYQVAEQIAVIDLVTGERRQLAYIGFTVEDYEVLRFSDDGGKLLMGQGRSLHQVWLEGAEPEYLPVGDAWVYAADADLDGSGDRVIWLGAEPDTAEGAEILILANDGRGVRALTDLPAGPARVASPRLSRDGTVVAFIATSSTDVSSMPTDFMDPHLVAHRLDEHGELGEKLVDVAIGGPATELALSADGGEALARVWFPGYGGASLVRVDLATGEVGDAFRSRGAGEVVDVTRDGRLAAIKRLGDHGPAAALWATDGAHDPIELPWVGAVSAHGERVVALRGAAPYRRALTVLDVAGGEERTFDEVLTSTGDPFIGPGGVLLSADGGRALVLSSLAVGRHPIPESPSGRRLWLVDTATGDALLVDQGLGQLTLHAAMDDAGRRVVYWTRSGPSAELRLFDVETGERQVLVTGESADSERPVAISPSGARVAYCTSAGYDATCRLAVADLGDGARTHGFPGLDVGGSLAIDDRGNATFVGAAPSGRGLYRFDTVAARLERLAPPVMTRALVRGGTCAWNTLDGGAIIARPGLPATPPPAP